MGTDTVRPEVWCLTLRSQIFIGLAEQGRLHSSRWPRSPCILTCRNSLRVHSICNLRDSGEKVAKDPQQLSRHENPHPSSSDLRVDRCPHRKPGGYCKCTDAKRQLPASTYAPQLPKCYPCHFQDPEGGRTLWLLSGSVGKLFKGRSNKKLSICNLRWFEDYAHR